MTHAPKLSRPALLSSLLVLLVAGAFFAGTRITGVSIKGHVVKLEVVDTPDAMRQGLMFRDKLDEDAGMLFVYPKSQPLTFWMKNTRLPLSIAFIDEHGVVVNIDDMDPFDEKNLHHSTKDAQYALEMNKGWFKAKAIVAGEEVHFLKTVESDAPAAQTTSP